MMAPRALPAQEGQAEVDPGAGVTVQAAQRVAVGGPGAAVLTAQQREVAEENVRVGLLGCVADGPGRLDPRLRQRPGTRRRAAPRRSRAAQDPGASRTASSAAATASASRPSRSKARLARRYPQSAPDSARGSRSTAWRAASSAASGWSRLRQAAATAHHSRGLSGSSGDGT
ncbi:hypothetical protein ABZV14_28105 [Streptosporangium canum]|uniref:hypothetical protein n=1 Tax=Streptosporangium canum TaxID=324952 RepID=UPI0033AA2478